MDFPALMPSALSDCKRASSEEELFNLLIRKTSDLVLFFETEAADETWSGEHIELTARLINWLTDQSFNNKLSIDLCKRTAGALQAHHHILEPMTPKNIEVRLKDTTINVNSLLLAISSDFFKNVLSVECRDKNTQVLNLPTISYDLFSPVLDYVNKGKIPDLWKKQQKEVEELLRQALSWNIEDMGKACQLTLKKYIYSENAIDLLIQAQQEHWMYFKQQCIDFINNRMSGFRLAAPTDERLAFEFYDFNDATLKVFQRLHPWITDLICKKALIEDVQFSAVVKKCPKLFLLDISGSLRFSEYLYDIPKDLQSINLAECFWLDQTTFKKMTEICPNIRELVLSNNYQLNFTVWGDLIKFKDLKLLNISSCHQISNDTLITIFKSCPHLTSLILDECQKIGDKGFFELAKNLPYLTTLSLVHCSISDSALLEIAARSRSLTSLNLRRCNQLTERGIKELAKHAFALKELNVSQCHVTQEAIEEIRERHRYLNFIFD